VIDEIVAVMRLAGQARYGARLNGLIVVLWRVGLRIHEALSLLESDLDCALDDVGHLAAIAPVTGQSLTDLHATVGVTSAGCCCACATNSRALAGLSRRRTSWRSGP